MEKRRAEMGGAAKHTGHHRVLGLDLLRALAVISVIIGHTLDHGAPPRWVVSHIGPLAVYGVELFFVLSGFLIGSILIRSAERGMLSSMKDVVSFWRRRWARTIPLYMFFLVVYLRFDYHGPADLLLVWSFFLFLQNFAWKIPPFFTHSWSLAVEEWFYLLLPLVYLAVSAVFKRKNLRFFLLALIFLCVPAFFRVYLGRNLHEWPDFDLLVRSTVVCRLDAIFAGVIVAYIKVYYSRLFDLLAKLWMIGLVGVVVAYVHLTVLHDVNFSRTMIRVGYFPFLSFSLAVIIPAAFNLKTTGVKILDRFFQETSRISYSLYLGHIFMLTTILGIVGGLGFESTTKLKTLILYGVLFAGYYLFAYLTYFFVEKPYIELRDLKLGNSDVRSGEVAVLTKPEG